MFVQIHEKQFLQAKLTIKFTSDISQLGIRQGLHKELLFVPQIVPIWLHEAQDSNHDRKKCQMHLGCLVRKPNEKQDSFAKNLFEFEKHIQPQTDIPFKNSRNM